MNAVRTAALLLVAPLRALAGQAVELVVREDSTRTPAVGAIVRLIGERGVVAQGLTSESGRFKLRAPGAGTFRIRVDRIGHTGLLTEPFTLGAEQTVHRELSVDAIRMVLPTLDVRAKNQCASARQSGPLAMAIWEEIQKALTANVITYRTAGTRLHVREFVREVSREGAVTRSWIDAAGIVSGQPFKSLPPAVLAAEGFAATVDDTLTFAAPDAVLLLSGHFVATHCFYPVLGKESLVGLAFDPTPDRVLPDVRGTVWVDRLTSELRSLDFSYTGLDRDLNDVGLGGRISFRRLPAGAWIIDDWYIRMPRLEPRLKGRALTGYIDRGGDAAPVGADARAESRSVLVGAVFDSTTGAGLQGAVIRVGGLTDSAVTGTGGRFRLQIPVAGPQVITAHHRKLGLVGEPPRQTGVLSIGDSTAVTFAVPPIAAFVRSRCGSGHERSGIIGQAFGNGGVPSEGLTVSTFWFPGMRGVRGARTLKTRTGPRGLFALCDLPPGRVLSLVLEAKAERLGAQEVRVEPGEFRWIDLRPDRL